MRRDPEWACVREGVYRRGVINGFGEYVFTAVFDSMTIHVEQVHPRVYRPVGDEGVTVPLKCVDGALRSDVEKVGSWQKAFEELTEEYTLWIAREIVR